MINAATKNEIVAVEYGPGSVRYAPEVGIAIAPTFMALQKNVSKIPPDYDRVCLRADQFNTVRGSLTGRKRVRVFDDGNAAWRTAVEKMLAGINACIEPLPASIILVRGDTIKPKPIDWLWNEWLARGKLHILAGAPGTGKTTLALALASIITTGGVWPDGMEAKVGTVLIWSGEDDPDDTLVPRLQAVNANMQNVHFIGGVDDEQGRRPFDPARDIVPLIDAVRSRNLALLIIDPIVSAVAGDSHKNTETRRALQPLVDLAGELGVAILGISHFSKGTAGRDPVERVTGSIAFGALPRVVMATAKLPDDKGGGRIFCRAKSNIGSDKGGFR